jgi:hypothetical protein
MRLKKTTDGARWLISLGRSRSLSIEGKRSRTETGKPSSRHTSSVRRETSNLFPRRPVVAGNDDVHGQTAQGSAQQLGSVLLDEVAKIAGVVKGAGLPLSQ